MAKELSMYEDIANLIVGMDAAKILAFKSSESNQKRFYFLVEKQREEGLSEAEKSELERFLTMNRMIGLAKAKAYLVLNPK